MERGLLIVGTGFLGSIAREVAQEMRCFDGIASLDDWDQGADGRLESHEQFLKEYPFALAALESPKERVAWIHRLEEAGFYMASLVSPSASVSPSAQLMAGTVVGPKAVVQAGAVVALGCIICAGAVVGQGAFVGDGCTLNDNSVVCPRALVLAGTTLECGEVFRPLKFTEESACPPEGYSFEVGM